MPAIFHLVAAFAFVSSVASQATVPAYLAKAEGDYFSSLIGGYPAARYQLFEGELRGQALSIGRVAFRMENNFAYDHRINAGGRTWTRVTLDVAPCDVAKFSFTFSANAVTTPKRVFASKVRWPGITGRNLGARPLPPAKINSLHSFPFAAPIKYDGKADLLLDWRFAGGVLTNNRPWSTTPNTFRDYQFDGYQASQSTKVHNSFGFARPWFLDTVCRDSAISKATAARTAAGVQVFGPSHSNASFANKMRFWVYSGFTAPGAPVIHAVSASGSFRGVDVGAGCNRLYVSLTGIWVPVRQTASNNALARTPDFFVTTPANPLFANQEFWAQTAWEDSKTKAFSLTTSVAVTIPPVPGSRKQASRLLLFNEKAGNSVGFMWRHWARPWNYPVTVYSGN